MKSFIEHLVDRVYDWWYPPFEQAAVAEVEEPRLFHVDVEFVEVTQQIRRVK